ncbi:FemAB family protein [Pseudodesulfovibrio hydrargyri]|uniref:FemAB family protein n=1 Tax=Pseudodesulfovibrio hydrargyri TaxID=2125990 RepID=A0A1J5MRK9_9BACT|nr:GNAT family N-acetyltransferase [Pseudodesulfovibrio hydrargyri]OIQ49238.1 FemAB family protein [Pseudodesulfovibrio hydrargyri]
MSTTVEWLGMEETSIWRDCLRALPDELNDVYLLPEYGALYEDEKTTPQCFLFKKDGEVFLYPFLRQETPFLDDYYDITTAYGYGGPVYTTPDGVFLSEALAAFDALAKERNIVAELIKFNPLLGMHQGLRPVFRGEIIPVCNTVFVEIDIDEEYRWTKEYTAANRKGIKKSLRADGKVEFSDSPEAWARFDELYSGTMRHNKATGFYYFSEAYFQAIRKRLPENHTLASAIIDGTIGASMILLHGNRYAYCHLIGTDPQYQRVGINNFLHHQCILWCKENGIKRLLIGGGRTRGDDDPLLKFKKNFSKQLSMFHVGERVLNRPVYDKLVDMRNNANPEPPDSGKLFKYRF